MSTETQTTPARQAYLLGRQAYNRPGALRAPALDPAVGPMIDGLPVGHPDSTAVLTEWLRGWDRRANAIAEGDEWPPLATFTYRGRPVFVIPDEAEPGHHDRHYADGFTCPDCGNDPCCSGFYPVDAETLEECEPVVGWLGLYRCADCGHLDVIDGAHQITPDAS